MHHIDVFNGDADGICALHQLRLVDPVDSQLVTGPKRDISLLKRVKAMAGDQVTVLDVALSKNREALDKLLEAGVQVRYFDHHQPGEIPEHPNFEPHIDTDANVCTSLLVNQSLQGRHLLWAVTAAFGDNLADAARQAAVPLESVCRSAGDNYSPWVNASTTTVTVKHSMTCFLIRLTCIVNCDRLPTLSHLSTRHLPTKF